MKSIKVIAFDRWGGGGSPVENTYAVEFDGVDDYAENTVIPYATLGGTFSFAFWIKPIINSNGHRYISCRGGGATGYFEITKNTNESLKFYFQGTSGTSGQKTTSAGTFPDNEWHHCVLTWNGSTLKIFVDGVLNKSDSSYSGSMMGKHLRCGGYQGGGLNTNVILDELAFWDKRLSATEVSEVYGEAIIQDLSALSTSSDLVHWWRMGDGDTFPTLQDSVGSLNMTMYNMTASDITTDTP
jgi:hypothetical protein